MATQAMVLVAADGTTTNYQPQRSPRPFPSAGVFAQFTYPLSEEGLRDAVVSNAIRSVLPTTQTVTGFQAFLHPDQIAQRKRGDFFLEAHGHLALRLVTLSRKVPPAIEKRVLAARIAAFVQRVGRQPLESELPVLKGEVMAQLLPNAPIQEQDQLLIFNPSRTRLFIESGTLKRAEETVNWLRQLYGSFPVQGLTHETPAQNRMTAWLAGEPLPEGLILGAKASLQDGAKAAAALRNHELDSDEVREHLLAGKQALAIELHWRNDFSVQYTASNTFTALRLGPSIKPTIKIEQMTIGDLRAVFGLGAAALFRMADRLFGEDAVPACPENTARNIPGPADVPRLPAPALRALPAPLTEEPMHPGHPSVIEGGV